MGGGVKREDKGRLRENVNRAENLGLMRLHAKREGRYRLDVWSAYDVT